MFPVPPPLSLDLLILAVKIQIFSCYLWVNNYFILYHILRFDFNCKNLNFVRATSTDSSIYCDKTRCTIYGLASVYPTQWIFFGFDYTKWSPEEENDYNLIPPPPWRGRWNIWVNRKLLNKPFSCSRPGFNQPRDTKGCEPASGCFFSVFFHISFFYVLIRFLVFLRVGSWSGSYQPVSATQL